MVGGMLMSLMLLAKVGKKGTEDFILSGQVLPHNVAASLLSLLFMVGLILLGVATARAGVFPPRAGQMLWLGAVLLVLGSIPDLTAVVAAGVALYSAGFAWMGWILWKRPLESPS